MRIFTNSGRKITSIDLLISGPIPRKEKGRMNAYGLKLVGYGQTATDPSISDLAIELHYQQQLLLP